MTSDKKPRADHIDMPTPPKQIQRGGPAMFADLNTQMKAVPAGLGDSHGYEPITKNPQA